MNSRGNVELVFVVVEPTSFENRVLVLIKCFVNQLLFLVHFLQLIHEFFDVIILDDVSKLWEKES